MCFLAIHLSKRYNKYFLAAMFKMAAILKIFSGSWLILKRVIQGCFLPSLMLVSGFELFLGYFGVIYYTIKTGVS